MKPEQDPAVCQKLQAAIDEIADRCTRPPLRYTSEGAHKLALTREPGHVPARVIARLAGLAKRHGFTVFRSRELEQINQMTGTLCLGATGGPSNPDSPSTVRLMRGLSPVSELRVLAHETAHVILGHAGLDYWGSERVIKRRQLRYELYGSPEDGTEEAAAELASAAFCQVAGIGNPPRSAEFIHQKLGGRPVDQKTRHAALLAARLLWAAAKPALH